MRKLSLDATAREQLDRARQSAGRSAISVFGGHEQSLRQTVIAMTSGAEMSEHESPGEATLQVLSGRVTLVAGTDRWSGRSGDLIIIPPARHSLTADEDAVVMLTVAKRA